MRFFFTEVKGGPCSQGSVAVVGADGAGRCGWWILAYAVFQEPIYEAEGFSQGAVLSDSQVVVAPDHRR